MTKEVLLLVGYLITLFLFHKGTAILAVSLDRDQDSGAPWHYVLVPAAINGTLFILCNMGHIGLMGNWMIFLPVLYLELRYLMHIRRWLAIGLALETVICGLSAILFYRSLLAIVLQKPLYAVKHAVHFIRPAVLCCAVHTGKAGIDGGCGTARLTYDYISFHVMLPPSFLPAHGASFPPRKPGHNMWPLSGS